jgi:hypothetical protein
MNKTVPVETGCYIDGSHKSFFDFACLVIEMAHDYGFELEWDTFVKDAQDLRNGDVDDEWIMDVLDAIDWTYQDALDYLNDNTREGLVWEVRDQSLFLMTVEDADASQ